MNTIKLRNIFLILGLAFFLSGCATSSVVTQSNQPPVPTTPQVPNSPNQLPTLRPNTTSGRTAGATQNAANNANSSSSGNGKGKCKNCKKYVIVIDAGHGGPQMTTAGKQKYNAEKKKIQAQSISQKQKARLLRKAWKDNLNNLSGSSWNNATSISGVLEKDLTLKYANYLKTALSTNKLIQYAAKKNIEYQVFLTRSTDINLSAADRRKVARTKKADVFLSIHFNGFHTTAGRGTETLYRTATNPSQSNEAEDKKLAISVLDAAYSSMKSIGLNTKKRGAKPDNSGTHNRIGVLADIGVKGLGSNRETRSTLWEVEFITNPDTEKFLVSGKDAVANGKVIVESVAKALIDNVK